MRVRLLCFASVKDIVGKREVVIELPAGTTALELLRHITTQYPDLTRLAPVLRLAVNQEYVEGKRPLDDGDEVALIPPVSGGVDLYQITEGPISLDALARAVGQHTSGAVAGFLGIVREFARGRKVEYLEYDAYPEMAVAKMRQIGEEIRRQWPVDRIAIVHRIGRLAIGEASVAIAVSSPHRREALEACAHAIERLKAIVPIWKREVWADGSEWVGSTVEEYKSSREDGQHHP